MTSYRELEIFQESKALATRVHELSLKFPKYELYEEGSQVRRSSKSITSNIVEGYGRRRYKAEFIRYLTFSIAECDETIVHLDFLRASKAIVPPTAIERLMDKYVILSKKINNFIKWDDDNFLE